MGDAETIEGINCDLEGIADPDYRAFQAKLVPNIEPEKILGVRAPALRRYARTLAEEREADARTFMAWLPHRLYDQDNLHGELIGLLAKTPQEAFAMLDAFLPCVDNWATCDLIRIPAFKQDLPAVLEKLKEWMRGEPEYMIRFAVVQLMLLFLDDAFEPGHLALVAGIERPEYYVNMARAWYFSFALVKQPDATLPLFERRPLALDKWTHNKSLQKARESRRVDEKTRAYLQSLKVR